MDLLDKGGTIQRAGCLWVLMHIASFTYSEGLSTMSYDLTLPGNLAIYYVASSIDHIFFY